jgi:hypothetical protein
VEPFEKFIAERDHAGSGAGRRRFRKTSVKAGGSACRGAGTRPRGEPDQPFGGDIDRIGSECVDRPPDVARRRYGEADLGIKRQRDGGMPSGRQQQQLMSDSPQLLLFPRASLRRR